MAKKEMAQKMKQKKGLCSWCAGWSAKDWILLLVSEMALYLFFNYSMYVLNNLPGFATWDSFVLFLLLNVAVFTCPVVRKHYL